MSERSRCVCIKLLGCIFVLSLFAACSPLEDSNLKDLRDQANANANGTPGLSYTPDDNNTAYSVSIGAADAVKIIIPASNNSLPVTAIDAGGFSGYTIMTSIVIPDSVMTIGNSAFLGCTGLKSVIIPEGVTSIVEKTFSGCTGLTSITIPAGVTIIGDNAFSGCGLTIIYYGGADLQTWGRIQKTNTGNAPIQNSGIIYCYSDTKPVSGHFWHWVGTTPAVW